MLDFYAYSTLLIGDSSKCGGSYIYIVMFILLKMPFIRAQCIFGVCTRMILRMYSICRLGFVTKTQYVLCCVGRELYIYIYIYIYIYMDFKLQRVNRIPFSAEVDYKFRKQVALLFRFATHVIILPCFPFIVDGDLRDEINIPSIQKQCFLYKSVLQQQIALLNVLKCLQRKWKLSPVIKCLVCALRQWLDNFAWNNGFHFTVNQSGTATAAPFHCVLLFNIFKTTSLNCHNMFTEMYDLRLQYSYRCFNFHEETDCNYKLII